jgi:hypothetical protein
VKFLYGVVGRDAAREKEAVRLLESLRHAALPSLRVVPVGPGCLATVTDRLAESLRDRYQEARGTPTEGHARGLPRGRLLGWLRAVAEGLDELARQTGLRHLGLTPRHLLFDDDRLRIADFGVLPLLWQPAGQLAGQLQARYAAPSCSSSGPARRATSTAWPLSSRRCSPARRRGAAGARDRRTWRPCPRPTATCSCAPSTPSPAVASAPARS